MAMIDRDKDEDFKGDRKTSKGKGRAKGSRNKSKSRGNRNIKRDYKEDTHVSETNDIAWYDKNPALLKAAASLPYGYPVGDPVNLENQQYNPTNHKLPVHNRMPGILTIDVVPGPGVSDGHVGGEIAAVNVASRDIYSFVRYANSGHSNYDPADLMMYMLAIDEIYMEIADAQRIYGIINLINPQNRFVPKYLVQALGWNYDDLIANLAQFRFAINSAAARIAALNMPMGFPYFDRHRWLFSNIYVDGTSPKAQLLAFKKVIFRTYDETGDQGSKLVVTKRPGLYTLDSWSTDVTNMINAVVGSEDCGIISGDILKAFGTDKCYSAQYMPDNYFVVPSYDEEVMSQISNATVFEGFSNLDISQDPSINKGTIVYNPRAVVKTGIEVPDINPACGNQILSFQKDTVTPEDTIIGSRLTAMLSAAGSIYDKATSAFICPVRSCGSEIAVGAHLWVFNSYNHGKLGSLSAPTFMFRLRDSSPNPILPSGNPFDVISGLAKFRFHHPIVVTEAVVQNGALADMQDSGVHYIRDIDTYTTVNEVELNNMHEQCILSEFSTPITIKVGGKL